MNQVFLFQPGYYKPTLVFSSWKDAEQAVIEKVRQMRPTFCCVLTIDQAQVNQDGRIHYEPHMPIKYTATIHEAGNLRMIKLEHRDRIILEETLVKYTVVDDDHLVTTQLENYADHSPRWIYFNERKSVKRGGYSRSVVGKIEKVNPKEEPWTAANFKFKAYCCASNRK